MKGTINGESLRDLYKSLRANVLSLDIYTGIMLLLYSIMALIFYPYVPMASSILFQNVLIASTIIASILLYSLTGSRVFALLRYFYIIPVIYIMYDQTHFFVRVVHPVDYDDVLIVVDRIIFGTDPTMWFSKYSFPALTEYLQICYFLFYLMPIMQAVELWKRNDIKRLESFARAMAFCYFISYVMYFGMPAVGPRFTLHDFSTINTDLPGLFLTNILRGLIDAGGGITWGAADPISIVNRDCMPSGHTMLTLVNISLAFFNRSKFRWFFAVVGGSLVISTVYLRYHYGIDVLFGAALVLLTLPLEPIADRAIKRYLDTK